MVACPANDNVENVEDVELEVLLCDLIGRRIRGLRIFRARAGLVIQGWTSTYHAKQLVQEKAMAIRRLPIAANDIEVRTARPFIDGS
jgi:hypothetical protein